MRHVVITAMCGPYPEAKDKGTEIWGVNKTYTVEPRLDRVYTFDPETLFSGDYVGELAALGVPVYTRDVHPDIPQSVKYPVDEITNFFGIEYFTCTIAYMIAHAIYENATGRTIDKLTLNGMFHPRDSMEYLWSLPCVNFWTGIAMGSEMRVGLYGYNAMCRPMPWESGLYGYRRNINADLCINTISAAYKACYEYPRKFVTASEELLPPEDREGLLTNKRVLTQRLQQVDEALERMAQPA